MFLMSYPAIFKPEPDDEGYVVSFPDLPEAHTGGKDLPESLEEAADVLGSALAFRIIYKEDIPPPSAPKRGQRRIAVPFWIAGKVALYMTLRERGWNTARLAGKLGITDAAVRRMLNPDHDTKSEKVQAALKAMGKRISAVIEDAA